MFLRKLLHNNVIYRPTLQLKLPQRAASSVAADGISVDYLSGDATGVVALSLNRPKAMNALSKALLAGISEAIQSIKYDRTARVVIFRSLVPGVFCAGTDLKEQAQMPLEEIVGPFVSNARALLTELGTLPQPVIAALDGVALGAGMEVALACDMRVAASPAKIGLTETKLAIIPGGGGTQRLPRLIGPSKAKLLMFTAEIVDGQQAADMGLVDDVVPQNDAGDAAYRHSVELAKRIVPNGPIGLAMVKKAVNMGMQTDLATGLAIEEACYAQVIPTKDRIEGLTAFKERRVPKYTGQ